ncbi:hypothetical protein T01_12835 [Trichinella spiralis]|uniref:Uncharacterized protein n=1 Tax=Trichinella spiralis TaxID=6334 RepID=A0A0V1BY05_TRISP|nr:hypothetical protein T01_12835 [Trichinella spiralis]
MAKDADIYFNVRILLPENHCELRHRPVVLKYGMTSVKKSLLKHRIGNEQFKLMEDSFSCVCCPSSLILIHDGDLTPGPDLTVAQISENQIQ